MSWGWQPARGAGQATKAMGPVLLGGRTVSGSLDLCAPSSWPFSEKCPVPSLGSQHTPHETRGSPSWAPLVPGSPYSWLPVQTPLPRRHARHHSPGLVSIRSPCLLVTSLGPEPHWVLSPKTHISGKKPDTLLGPRKAQPRWPSPLSQHLLKAEVTGAGDFQSKRNPKGHVQGYETKGEGRMNAPSTERLLARAPSAPARDHPKCSLTSPCGSHPQRSPPTRHRGPSLQDAGPSQAGASPRPSGDSQPSEQGLAECR